MFLTVEDLATVTGFVRRDKQIGWLRRHGWRFTVSGLGSPVVSLAEMNRHMVGGKAKSQEPRFEAMNG